MLQAEERERERDRLLLNKKLAKPVSNVKPAPSPRTEHRKGAFQTSLSFGSGSSVTGVSPTMALRNSGYTYVYIPVYYIYITFRNVSIM